MKKLAYFLVLFVGMNNAFADRVGDGGSGSGYTSGGGGGGNCNQGDVYMQIMHWRTFVVAYGSRCFSKMVTVYGQNESGQKVPIQESQPDPAVKAEMSQYINAVSPYFRSDAGGPMANKMVAEQTRLNRSSGGGEGGGAYGNNQAVDMCAVRLGQDYHTMIQSQGPSAFCAANRAKYQELIGDKNINSIKQRAQQAVCGGGANFGGGYCSPQSGLPTSSNNSVYSTSSTGGSGTSDYPTARPAQNASDKISTASDAVDGPQRGQDADAPPAGAKPALSASAPAPQPAPATPGADKPAAKSNVSQPAKPKTQSKDTATADDAKPAKGSLGTAGDTGDGGGTSSSVPSGVTGSALTKPQSAAATPASTGKGETATADRTKSSSAKPHASLNKESYRDLFTGSSACKENKTAAKVAHVDAMMNVYGGTCLTGEQGLKAAFNPYATFSRNLKKNHSISTEMSNDYLKEEKSRMNDLTQTVYCTTRRDFFKDVVTVPNDSEITKFANSVMCK